jgi:hypothetical protein
MRLHIDIKPKRVIIPNPSTWGMNMGRQLAGINGIAKVANRACFSVGSDGKIHWSAHTDINNQTVYVYNVEHHKRGKYKNKKEFVIYVYTFKMEVLKALGLSIEQKHYNFKLYKTDSYGKKIYL